MLKWNPFGEMAEWFKAPVLKTGVGQLTVGSNPSLSADAKIPPIFIGGIFGVFFIFPEG